MLSKALLQEGLAGPWWKDRVVLPDYKKSRNADSRACLAIVAGHCQQSRRQAVHRRCHNIAFICTRKRPAHVCSSVPDMRADAAHRCCVASGSARIPCPRHLLRALKQALWPLACKSRLAA